MNGKPLPAPKAGATSDASAETGSAAGLATPIRKRAAPSQGLAHPGPLLQHRHVQQHRLALGGTEFKLFRTTRVRAA